MIELLAPAGDLEKFQKVIQYGADAVYLGLNQFNLRAAGGNFDNRTLPQVIAEAHSKNVKVYVTLNSLARDTDFSDLEIAIKDIADAKADAVIISDPGVMQLVKDIAPEIDIHISTQSSVLNSKTAKFWYDQGATRIILARELSLKEIREFRKALPKDLELEAFVHGAMCMSYSGRCLLSDYYNKRSANRGACTQPCRWNYEVEPLLLTEQGHKDRPLILEQDENGSYLMSSSDLCMIEYIPELVEAGIVSFKIEGRTKSAFYASTIVKTYREAIDYYLQNPDNYQVKDEWLENLNHTVHRHYDTGFFFQDTAQPLAEQDAKIHAEKTLYKQAKVIAEVRDQLNNEYLVLEQKNKVEPGTKVDLIMPKGDTLHFEITELFDLNKNEIDSTPHPKMLFLIPFPDAELIPKGSYLRQLEQ
ncbi:MAG: U32 family peptidase [Clostridiaceae bacterium]|nr:U32 family peptidase [Clostridiaceae bacterium]